MLGRTNQDGPFGVDSNGWSRPNSHQKKQNFKWTTEEQVKAPMAKSEAVTPKPQVNIGVFKAFGASLDAYKKLPTADKPRDISSAAAIPDTLKDVRASVRNGDIFKTDDLPKENSISSLRTLIQDLCSSNASDNNGNSDSLNNSLPDDNNSDRDSDVFSPTSVTSTIDSGVEISRHRDRSQSRNSSVSVYTAASAQLCGNNYPKKYWLTKYQCNEDAIPSKMLTYSVTACCAVPKLRVFCNCCKEESLAKDVSDEVPEATAEKKLSATKELRPRIIPVATSQLGFCPFCQANGETPEVYQSHNLRTDKGKVSCPVLREYNCPICNSGGGDFAHTIKYCPLARKAKPQS